MFKMTIICLGLGVVLLAVFVLVYILYTSTKDAYKTVTKKVSDYYSLRAQIKKWEEEELNREVPREWAGSH
jgi:hypothetical protein